jgi:acyl carrier protein
MTTEQIYIELTRVFRDVLQAEDLVIGPTTVAEDVKGWDSAAHVNLILAIEMELNVVFNTGEIDEMRTVGDLVDAIERKLANR